MFDMAAAEKGNNVPDFPWGTMGSKAAQQAKRQPIE